MIAQFYPFVSHQCSNFSLIISPTPLKARWRQMGLQKDRQTYPTHNSPTPPTPPHQIPRTLPHLPLPRALVLHKIPIRRPCPITQRMVPIQLQRVVCAAQGAAYELGAVLEEVCADLAAGAGEVVEGVEVEVGGYECYCAVSALAACFSVLSWTGVRLEGGHTDNTQKPGSQNSYSYSPPPPPLHSSHPPPR